MENEEILDLPVIGRAGTMQSVDDASRTFEVLWTTGAQVRTFHSCQTVSRAEFDGGATYISLMTANAAVLKEGLS